MTTIPERTDEAQPLNPEEPRKSKPKKRKPVWKSEETDTLIRLVKTVGYDHEKLYKAEQAHFQKYNRVPADIKYKIRQLKRHNIL